MPPPHHTKRLFSPSLRPLPFFLPVITYRQQYCSVFVQVSPRSGSFFTVTAASVTDTCATCSFNPICTFSSSLHPLPRTLPTVSLHFHSSTTAVAFSPILTNLNMPRGVRKQHLPTKVCVACKRPFNWCKKWERCWDQVTTCSKSCNQKRRDTTSKKREVSNNQHSSWVPGSSSSSIAAVISDTSDDHQQISLPSCEPMTSSEDPVTELHERVDLITLVRDNSRLDSDEKLTSSPPSDEPPPAPLMDPKAQRKAEKKRKKQERRAQRQGRGDPSAGQKQCTRCSKAVDLLIRCTYDPSEQWGMVCGKCWNQVSGGVVDGDNDHPYYRYGGLWKNRRAHSRGVSDEG